MKLRLLAAAIAAMTCLSSGAMAAPLHADGMTMKEVQAWLLEGGYKAERVKDGDDEYLKSAAEGVNFEVHVYDCKKDRCASMQMMAGFDMDDRLSLEKVNAWNSDKRYVDCFVDEEGDPWFTYDINLSPGGTRESLDDDFAVWRMFLPDMRRLANGEEVE